MMAVAKKLWRFHKSASLLQVGYLKSPPECNLRQSQSRRPVSEGGYDHRSENKETTIGELREPTNIRPLHVQPISSIDFWEWFATKTRYSRYSEFLNNAEEFEITHLILTFEFSAARTHEQIGRQQNVNSCTMRASHHYYTFRTSPFSRRTSESPMATIRQI